MYSWRQNGEPIKHKRSRQKFSNQTYERVTFMPISNEHLKKEPQRDESVTSEGVNRELERLLDGITPEKCRSPEDEVWLYTKPAGREIL